MLELDKREAELLDRAIRAWRQEQLISEEQAGALQKSYAVRSTDWQTITL